MWFMYITLAVFQPATSPLKAAALKNMLSMALTLAVLQPDRLPLKAVAPLNM